MSFRFCFVLLILFFKIRLKFDNCLVFLFLLLWFKFYRFCLDCYYGWFFFFYYGFWNFDETLVT